jgi:hypothetical protein
MKYLFKYYRGGEIFFRNQFGIEVSLGCISKVYVIQERRRK